VRILLLTQVVPFPPDSGPKIKTYNVLRYLAQRHEVHLVSFARSTAEEQSAHELLKYCATVSTAPLRRSRHRDAWCLMSSLLRRQPFLITRDDSRAMRAVIGRLMANYTFDAAHADQLSMAQFAEGLSVPLRVLDEHNAVWTIVQRAAAREPWGPRRLLAELEWRKLRGYEGSVCRAFDHVTVVSDEDRLALEAAAGSSFPTSTIPIAVDVDELAFVERTPESRHVVSVATMFYPPNVDGVYWFATEVFPLVRNRLPDVQFRIVGSRPPQRIRALATGDRGIVVMGYVPDLEPVLRESAVMVVPVHSGSGMRVKILEAFARGIPVVSTTIGVEGIEAQAGEHLLVADDPESFATQVVRLATDREQAARLATAGRALAETRYDWRTALSGLDVVYGVTSGDRPSPWQPATTAN
jgi:polysaccharide biosynthesis protein PslH